MFGGWRAWRVSHTRSQHKPYRSVRFVLIGTEFRFASRGSEASPVVGSAMEHGDEDGDTEPHIVRTLLKPPVYFFKIFFTQMRGQCHELRHVPNVEMSTQRETNIRIPAAPVHVHPSHDSDHPGAPTASHVVRNSTPRRRCPEPCFQTEPGRRVGFGKFG